MNAIEIARLFKYVRESKQNRGLRVEAIQHWSTGTFGDSWCAEFATFVLDILFQGNSPIPRLSRAEAIRSLCEYKGWMRNDPATVAVGDLYFYVNPQNFAHHVGFVTQLQPLTGISGNTSDDGTSDNGNGVYEHAIAATHFATYPQP